MKQDTLQIQYEDCMIHNVLFVVTSSGVAFFLLNGRAQYKHAKTY